MNKLRTSRITTADLVSWGLLAMLFMYMLVLNHLMPLHRDDYWYSLVWGTMDHLSSWSDIFKSLYTHYFTHGGRMVAYVVLDSFLFVGKQWFDPFNAFLFVALVVLMYWYAQRRISLHFNPYILAAVMAFAWLGFPHFGEVCLWMAGACGYLFTTVLILLFLLPYYFRFVGQPVLSDSLPALCGMLVLGVAAGWTIENTAATTAFAAVGFAVYFYKQHTGEKWMVSGAVGAVVGMLMLVGAPGNYVRYTESATPKIYHITNLFAAGIETLFYALPIVLFIILAWRLMKVDYAYKQLGYEKPPQEDSRGFMAASVLVVAAIMFLVVSYLNGSFFSTWLGNMLYLHVAVPAGIAKPHLHDQLFNVMAGVEEFAIYLLVVAQLFRYAFRAARLRKRDLRALRGRLRAREVLASYPTAWYAVAWIALAIFNHCVMVASPRFPGRAAFGSVAFLIIGAASVFSVPELAGYFLAPVRRKVLALFAAVLLVPLGAAAMYQGTIIYNENTARLAYIEKMAAAGVQTMEVAPISTKNRVLRHLYYVDLDNGLSRTFLCNYYGVRDITLQK